MNKETKDQIAKVMLLHGAEEKKNEAILYCSKKVNPCTMSGRPSDKWIWMMNYCRVNGIPPAQEWAWEEAGESWDDAVTGRGGND